jgi:hypothetical protein
MDLDEEYKNMRYIIRASPVIDKNGVNQEVAAFS